MFHGHSWLDDADEKNLNINIAKATNKIKASTVR
jgi:hypothetical protein